VYIEQRTREGACATQRKTRGVRSIISGVGTSEGEGVGCHQAWEEMDVQPRSTARGGERMWPGRRRPNARKKT
jgi:hypothetical protein